jgi:hypothetical protein
MRYQAMRSGCARPCAVRCPQRVQDRPDIVAGSQTALKHSSNRPDQDFTRSGLSRFVINFFLSRAQGGQLYTALLSDSALDQFEVHKTLVWKRGWGGEGKSEEDVYEVLIMDDSLRKLLPDLVIVIEIERVQWLETATCERGFPLRTQILTAQRYSMGDSLLAGSMMICSNGPSLDQKEEMEKFLLAAVARFKAFKKRVPSNSFLGKRRVRAEAFHP